MISIAVSVITGAMRWLTITALPVIGTSLVVGLFVRAGVGIGSMVVIMYSAEYMRDFVLAQVSALGGNSVAGAYAMDMLSLFGIFEGLSLIISSYLAKATWLMIQPSLTWLTTPPSN